MSKSSADPNRRTVIAGLAVSTIALQVRPIAAQTMPAFPSEPILLRAGVFKHRLRPAPSPETEVWGFDGRLPGAVIRIAKGAELRLKLVNDTPAPLSLHWCGLRGANAADGVAGLTGDPVPPGDSRDIATAVPDSGFFLARPIIPGSSSQLAERGISALLVVDEETPPLIAIDVAVVIDDWLLGEDGALAPFGSSIEAASTGRLGNWLSVDGAPAPREIRARPGSRVRLRLANACNARMLRIRFVELRVFVAAIDSQPTDRFEPLRSTLPFPPGTRYDVFVDVPAAAGTVGTVTALLGSGAPLIRIIAEGEPVSAGEMQAGLSENRALPSEIRLQRALRRDVAIEGGATRGGDGRPVYRGDERKIWTVNGQAGSAGASPLFAVKRGEPVVLAISNKTAFPQPIHLHGHVFRLLHALDDGWEPYWLDTTIIPEGRTIRIAFVADNPGRWMLGSSVLERLDTGLWTWFEVS